MKNFVSNVIAGIVAAAIFAFLSANYETILGSLNISFNAQLIASIAAVVVFGICVGWLLRGLIVWRSVPRSIKRKKSEVDEANRKAIMQTPEREKRFLKAVAQNGEVYCRPNEWEWGWDGNQRFLHQFLNLETVEGNRLKITPNDILKQFFEEHNDLFDVISDSSLIDYAIYDVNKNDVPNWSKSNEITWWWYTDDPSIKEEQDRRMQEAIENGRRYLTSFATKKH